MSTHTSRCRKQLSADEAKHVLGAQGQIWTEYMPDPKRVEYMAWPRLIALAEVLWSPGETRNWADFQNGSRLTERLAILDVNYRGRSTRRTSSRLPTEAAAPG